MAEEIGGRRLRALFDALAERRGEVVAFDHLVARVWPDEPPVNPRAALRTLIHRLRETEQVVTEPTGYRLRARPPSPHELPADLPDFVGRQRELARLSVMDTPVRAITGPPGVGKTALVIREAHRLRERFPDGQLYVNLRGYSTGPPVTVEQVLVRFVKALGGGPDDDYRALLAGRRVLVVLDNATADVLEPLLPATPGCVALVTSRQDLPMFAQLRLGVLGDDEARDLLKSMRVDGDTDELISLCARLPLALRIAGANLAGRHLPDYVGELREHRLAALEIEDDTAVQAAFDLSYRKLTPPARRTFDFLGAVPGPDAPAALLDDAVAELVEANLVQESAGRYQLHDLLRLYAHARAREEDRRRVFDWYLAMADGADAELRAGFNRLLPPVEDRHEFASRDEAVAWFDAERQNLVALAQDQPSAQLVAAVRGYLLLTGHHADLRLIARAALGETGERAAATHATLGFLEWRFGEHPAAIEHAEQAIAAFREAGRQSQEATTLNILAGIYHDIGSLDLAQRYLAQAIELYGRNDMPIPLLGGLSNLGLLELELGRLESAAGRLMRSVELARETGEPQHAANGLCNLGVVQAALGGIATAERTFGEALELSERYGLRHIEQATRVELAEMLVSAGRVEEAREHAEQALDLAAEDDLFIEIDASLVLAEANRSLAEYDDVVRRAADGQFRIIEVRALAGKAALLRDHGDVEGAITLCRKAIDRAEERGLVYRADLVRALLATCEGR